MRLSEFEYGEIQARLDTHKRAKTSRNPEARGYTDFWTCGGSTSDSCALCNPYLSNSPEARRWFKGWLAASADNKEASK